MDGKKRLEAVQHEVNDLHPLLNQLFQKMPDMEQVYYTHGPSEMGADFILYRRDPTLKQTHHIGIVAKLGAIKQDHGDVIRQIEECSVPRVSPDARGEIVITETWVVCTGEITTNAKSKIADKFRGRKVEFIPGQRLAQLIDQLIPQATFVVPIPLQHFREAQIANLSRLDERTALVPGGPNVFICPDIVELRLDVNNELKRYDTYSNLEEIAVLVLRSKFILLESAMGGGKSRVLREFTRLLLGKESFGEGKIVPLYISCAEFKDRFNLDLDALCNAVVPNQSEDILSTVIVVLDGLDEIKLQPDARVAALKRFVEWTQISTTRRVVLSTRPIDARESFGPSMQNVCLLRLERLKGRKALEFFKSVCGTLQITNRIARDLTKSALVKAFEATPIAYTLLARVMNDNNQEIPASIPELFSKYFELILGRWEIDKGQMKQVEFQAMQACLSRISIALLDAGRGEMPRAEAVSIIEDYLLARPFNLSAQEMLRLMCERTLVLFYDESSNSIGFRHKSFAEYFYALELSKNGADIIRDDAFSLFWVGVYYFLAGIKKDCPKLIDELLKVRIDSSKRMLRILNFGSILQAGYMTPKKTISGALLAVFGEAADLYLDSKGGAGGRELGKFSVMQLLSLFRMVVSEMYGYEYFRSALEDVVLDLGDGPPNERDALVLFFATIAYGEAAGEVDFDSLISRHGDYLPLELRLAIGHEAKKFDAASKLVKRMQKNLKDNILEKQKGGSSDIVRRIYYAPLGDSDTVVVFGRQGRPGSRRSRRKG